MQCTGVGSPTTHGLSQTSCDNLDGHSMQCTGVGSPTTHGLSEAYSCDNNILSNHNSVFIFF